MDFHFKYVSKDNVLHQCPGEEYSWEQELSEQQLASVYGGLGGGEHQKQVVQHAGVPNAPIYLFSLGVWGLPPLGIPLFGLNTPAPGGSGASGGHKGP